jgi:hypothetical protein
MKSNVEFLAHIIGEGKPSAIGSLGGSTDGMNKDGLVASLTAGVSRAYGLWNAKTPPERNMIARRTLASVVGYFPAPYKCHGILWSFIPHLGERNGFSGLGR